MNETKFIKTVIFGGYDKQDTNEHINNLYKRISALETELETIRLLHGKNDISDNNIIAELNQKLAESSADNKKLSFRIQTLASENKALENEVNNLKYSVAELEHNLSDADMKLLSMSQKDDTAVFGAVFASAKKSAEEIIESAKKNADNLKSDSEKLAGNIIAEANNQASEIIYEAELYATEMTAEVSEETASVIPENIRSLVLDDISRLSGCIENFRKCFSEFITTGNQLLEKSGNMLAETRNTITEGGLPVFCAIDMDLPEKPVCEPTDYSYKINEKIPENKEKPVINQKSSKKSDLVAEYYNNQDYTIQNSQDFDSYDYDYNYDQNSPDFKNIDKVNPDDDDDLSGLFRNLPRSNGGVSFKALDRQAEAFMDTLKTEKSDKISLSDLTAQAQALGNNEVPVTSDKKNSGTIDLATLMAQAEALDD
ncbi:MAG: DivIVA domain-containing protein [Ruminococcus sp.]|nr:DivIVA domain-containing protein [Ruminococcus sp.]